VLPRPAIVLDVHGRISLAPFDDHLRSAPAIHLMPHAELGEVVQFRTATRTRDGIRIFWNDDGRHGHLMSNFQQRLPHCTNEGDGTPRPRYFPLSVKRVRAHFC